MRLRPLVKVLIANRGEIARRVARAARAEGLRCVAVYSEADRDALHVSEADEAVCIGPAPAHQSYLDGARIIEAAHASGADAVHPGYGFLSENAAFARACEDASLVFVGPTPAAMELMGNKRLAKQAVRQAGVPCIPGYSGTDQSLSRLAAEGRALGFPLVVKAAAGGGGRGIRLVRDGETLLTELALARAEARAAFDDEELLLERAMLGARHVEVQVLADAHSALVHLGERDCSTQRRHQKVIEEAPSPAVDAALRARLGEAATAVARACAYVGAGTVEFLVDAGGRFYFLEMNTRIQVEHPVTEAITGIDLVAWQLRIAAGARLRMRQEDIQWDGHAIEARLYAEDPRNNFLPQSGRVRRWRAPAGAGVRVEHAVREGAEVGVHYDALLAKVIASGPDRERARLRLLRALADTELLGVISNKAFLTRALQHPTFVEGHATTDFLDGWVEPPDGTPVGYGLAAILFYTKYYNSESYDTDLTNWRSSGDGPRCSLRLSHREHVVRVELRPAGAQPGDFRLTVDGEVIELAAVESRAGRIAYALGGVRRTAAYVFVAEALELDLGRDVLRIEDSTFAPARAEPTAGDGRVRTPMAGMVQDVLVACGDRVACGQGLIVVESMKMLHTIAADTEGVVGELAVRAGDSVRARQVLAVLIAVTGP